jgi:hypothetical protein
MKNYSVKTRTFKKKLKCLNSSDFRMLKSRFNLVTVNTLLLTNRGTPSVIRISRIPSR